jgi:Fe-S oxidoreductase
MPNIGQAAKQTDAWACYDCGKCTATCPIGRVGGNYSPRRNVMAALANRWEDVSANGQLFQCLTCSLCDQRCPANVGYTDLIQMLRETAWTEGMEPECPHGGALQSMMRIMAKGEMKQDRLGWMDRGLKTHPEKGGVFFWTGCAMYYDALFHDFEVSALDGTRAAIRLLNHLGVTPVVSPEERCCGHDLLWNGDRKNFERLAEHNVKLVVDSGADTLVTSCAECLRTWSIDYQPWIKGKPKKVMHLTEFLAERLPELKPKANGNGTRRVTYQDPCRLGRHLGVYEPPRQVMKAMPGVELVEMRHRGPGATCCAGGTWSNCDCFAKKIQVDRLREARATESEVMVTACPKCQLHFRCAMKDPNLGGDIEIEMCDVAELVADRLGLTPKKKTKQPNTGDLEP